MNARSADQGSGDAPAEGPVRISKLLAEQGLCSRREADAFIEQGLVLLDGQPVTELGARALRHQVVSLAPGALKQQAKRMTVILNKPIGHVSHADDDDRYPPAVRLITPARVDVESTPGNPPLRGLPTGSI